MLCLLAATSGDRKLISSFIIQNSDIKVREPLRRSAQRLPSSSALAVAGKYWEEVREAPHCGPEAPQAIPPSLKLSHVSLGPTVTSQHRLTLLCLHVRRRRL